VRALPQVAQATLFGDALHVRLRAPDADWAGVRGALVAAGVTVHDDRAVEASLEDVFMALTDA
jgi:hypothetical protein